MIYVASSWRNKEQPEVIAEMRAGGVDVYDFRNPSPTNTGFHWSQIDPNWENWTPEQFSEALDHPVAALGFGYDYTALNKCRAAALIMPCGRSAHLEFGYILGQNKPGAILLRDGEPELMYAMATTLLHSREDLVEWAIRL